jgi:heptosyltransferase III
MLQPQILVTRQLALGDVIWITPIIRQIWRDYGGDCRITVVTLKPEVFANNPWVSEVLSAESAQSSGRKYDKTINLDLAYERYPAMHLLEAYAKFSHGSVDLIEDHSPALFPSLGDSSVVGQILEGKGNQSYVVVHLRRDTWPSRNLPEAQWKAIIDALLTQTDHLIYQVGSTHEISFDHHPRLVNLLGKVSIQQLKLLIEKSVAYIGIDSGTLHVAACTQTPIVSMFTSAHHSLREPRGRNRNLFVPVPADIACYGCQSRLPPPTTGVVCPRGDVACLQTFSPSRIVTALQSLMS